MANDNIYRKKLEDQNLEDLVELCRNVARNHSVSWQKSTMAHNLCREWLRLTLDQEKTKPTKEQLESLKKSMADFLGELPSWMSSGI